MMAISWGHSSFARGNAQFEFGNLLKNQHFARVILSIIAMNKMIIMLTSLDFNYVKPCLDLVQL